MSILCILIIVSALAVAGTMYFSRKPKQQFTFFSFIDGATYHQVGSCGDRILYEIKHPSGQTSYVIFVEEYNSWTKKAVTPFDKGYKGFYSVFFCKEDAYSRLMHGDENEREDQERAERESTLR